MTTTELLEIISHGENSGVEFKRDDIDAEKLARQLVAFANLRGGKLLLGVEDDGTISGIIRRDLEEWVMNVSRDKIVPPVIPFFEILREVEQGNSVAVVTVAASPTKPCRVLHNGRRTAYIRVGTTVREPSDDELAQMLQSSQRLNFGRTPMGGVQLADLHRDRLEFYFEKVLGYGVVGSEEEMLRTAINLELMAQWQDKTVATVNGLLLFGRRPRNALPQSGMRAIAYSGDREHYQVSDDLVFPDPLIPALDQESRVVEPGLVERAMGFIARHCPAREPLDGARNVGSSEFPDALLREVLVNAVAHRDYTIAGADILLSIFSNRIEVKSPGRLPNGATVEALREGFRYYRNQTLVNVLRDYKYIDARGMGIRVKVIPLTRELTGQDAEFRATDYDFTVVLPRPLRAGVGRTLSDD